MPAMRASSPSDMPGLVTPPLFADASLDVVDYLLQRRARAVQAGDTELQELRLVLVWDDAAAGDDYVLASVLLDEPLHLGKGGHVGSVQERERDNVDVLVDRH